MQLAEPEIILPLQIKPAIRRRLIFFSFIIVGLLVYSAWFNALDIRLEGDHVNWLLLILWALFTPYCGWFVMWCIRKLYAPAPTLYVSHEGIFFSVLIRWDEISAIFPYTPPGAGLAVGIVVRDDDAFLARYVQEKSSGLLMRFAIRVNTWLSRRIPGFRAQVNIRQYLLPLSIHEFIAEIHARFAAELHEHQITIREWEY